MSITTQESFDVFYVDYDHETQSFDINKVVATEPNLDVLHLIGEDLNILNKFDIQNFNFIIFENDINFLSDGEFEFFWTKFFEPWIQTINDNYLDLHFEDFKASLMNTEEKKFLVKKIVHFFMTFLPYNLFGSVLKKYPSRVTNKSQLINNLQQLIDEGCAVFKHEIIDEINKNISHIENLKNSIFEVSQFSKKNTLENNQKLLIDQLNKQLEYFEIFKTIIDKTPLENLYNLLILYVNKDFENLA